MIQDILDERAKTHGSFRSNSLFIQDCKDAARTQDNWEGLPPYVKESIDMILHKLGRVICGDYKHKDSWVDIIGYSQLVLDNLNVK